MIIILEGTDLVGKSSLAKVLSKQTGFPIIYDFLKFKNEEEHHKYVDVKAHAEYKLIKNLQYYFKVPLIFDRFIISNIAYNSFYNRNYDISYNKKEDWQDLKIVYICLESEEVIKQRLNARGDFLNLSVEKIIKLKNEYEKALQQFNYPYLRLDGSLPIEINITNITKYIYSNNE